MKKKRVLLVLDGLFYSRMPIGIIQQLKSSLSLELVVLLLDWNHPDYVKEHLAGCSIYYGLKSGLIRDIAPNLILCCQTWWEEMPELLPEAIQQNIPILMYDHGSLLTTCEYLLQRDEIIAIYRSDVTLCSHIACWGRRPRDCWLSYGVPPQKMHITGAAQYDYLAKPDYRPKESREHLLQRLSISPDAQVILFYIHYFHTHIDKKQRARIMGTLNALEKYVRQHPNWVLVLKPHPMTMAVSQIPFPHAPQTLLVANTVEKCWDGMLRADPDSLAAAASVIITTISSMVISPLTLQKPIIHLELDTAAAREFSHYGRKVFYNLKKGMSIANLLNRIDQARFLPPDLKENARLTADLNDGYASSALPRFISLVEQILDEQEGKALFYPLSREEEFWRSARLAPKVPYAFHNLVMLYLDRGDIQQARKAIRQYQKNFRNPVVLFERILRYRTQQIRELSLELAESLTHKRGKSAKELLYIGKVFHQNRRFAESATWLKRLLRKNDLPATYRLAAWFILGEIAGREDPRKKQTCFTQAVRTLPSLNCYLSDIETYNIASTLQNNGQFRKSRQWFQKVVQITPVSSVRAGAYFHLGEMAKEQNDLPRAMALLRKSLDLNPKQKKAHEYLVQLLLETGDFPGAKPLIQSYFETFRDPPGLSGILRQYQSPLLRAFCLEQVERMVLQEENTIEESFFIAEQYYENNRFPQSEPWIERLLAAKECPLRFRLAAWFYRGEIAGQRDPQRRKNCHARAVRLLPRSRAWLEDGVVYNIASTLKMYGHPNLARRWFGELADRTPSDKLRAGAYFHLGQMAWEQKDSSQATSMFQKALEQNPDHKKAHECLVNLSLETGDFPKAQSLIKEYVAAFRDPVGLCGSSNRYQTPQSRALYLELAETLILKKSKTPEEIFFIGEQLYDTNRSMESVPWFKKIAAKKDSPIRFQLEALFCLGEIAGQKDSSKKKSFQAQAIGLLPGVMTNLEDGTIYNIASTLKKHGQYPLAREWFQELEQRNPSDTLRSGVYFHLGEMTWTVGNPSQAATLFRKALEINPEHQKAREYLDQLDLGSGTPTGSSPAKEAAS